MDASFGPAAVHIELTRRNLRSLLAKLDGHPPDSGCSIYKVIDGQHVLVRAVEDEAHYADRSPGEAHPDTEAHIA